MYNFTSGLSSIQEVWWWSLMIPINFHIFGGVSQPLDNFLVPWWYVFWYVFTKHCKICAVFSCFQITHLHTYTYAHINPHPYIIYIYIYLHMCVCLGVSASYTCTKSRLLTLKLFSNAPKLTTAAQRVDLRSLDDDGSHLQGGGGTRNLICRFIKIFTSLRDGNRPHRIVGQPLVTANDVGHWDQKHPKVLIVGKKNAKNLIAMYSGPTQFKK